MSLWCGGISGGGVSDGNGGGCGGSGALQAGALRFARLDQHEPARSGPRVAFTHSLAALQGPRHRDNFEQIQQQI